LSQTQLNTLHELPTDIPEGRNIRIYENGTVEIFNNGNRISIELFVLDYELMCVLINIFKTPALDAQMMIDKANGTLVLLKRNRDDLERLPAMSN
jgi:hypothetical protein